MTIYDLSLSLLKISVATKALSLSVCCHVSDMKPEEAVACSSNSQKPFQHFPAKIMFSSRLPIPHVQVGLGLDVILLYAIHINLHIIYVAAICKYL